MAGWKPLGRFIFCASVLLPFPVMTGGCRYLRCNKRPLKAGLIDKLFNMVTMLNDERLLIKSWRSFGRYRIEMVLIS